jgi:hypothetical protein
VIRFLVYPLVAPLVFGLAFSLYHWKTLTLDLAGRNVAYAYALILLPSMIVAAVDWRGFDRKSDTRLMSCILTMLLVTVVPFAAIAPGALFEENFLPVMVLAALVSTAVCYWISTLFPPNWPAS